MQTVTVVIFTFFALFYSRAVNLPPFSGNPPFYMPILLLSWFVQIQ